ncbi:hypothetical protein [Halobaculum sp. MBLA0143]|uniref:hypothetical protein n=1 Tax=Halobaculum sp. MBLA0143 TaxID=3079933 RepID=UPI0035261E90
MDRPPSPSPRGVVAVALLLVVAVPAVAPAVAAPPPDPICSACAGFETAAADAGVPVDLRHATATVALARNGTAAWTVRLRVDDRSARTFAADRELRRSVAADAVTGRGLPSVRAPVPGLSTSVSNQTVVVRFRDPDAGRREAGLLVATFLRPTDGVVVDATDRVRIRGPSETTLLAGGEAVDAAVDGRRVTLSDPGPAVSRTLLVFGPPDTPPGVAAAATTATLSPAWLRAVVRVGPLPAAVGAVLAAGFAVAVFRVGDRDRTATTVGRRLLIAVAVGSVPLTVGVAGGGLPTELLAAVGPYLVVGLTAWRRPTRLRSRDGLAAVTVAGAAAAFLIAVACHGSDPGRALRATGRVAPVILAAVAGTARRRLTTLAVWVVGAVVVVASSVGPDGGSGLLAVVLTVVVAAGLVAAVPLAVVAGAATPRRHDARS